MPKHMLSKEDLAHLDKDQPYSPNINPRIESEYCGCDYCMSEWVEAEEYDAPKKEGFKIDEIVVDDEH